MPLYMLHMSGVALSACSGVLYSEPLGCNGLKAVAGGSVGGGVSGTFYGVYV